MEFNKIRGKEGESPFCRDITLLAILNFPCELDSDSKMECEHVTSDTSWVVRSPSSVLSSFDLFMVYKVFNSLHERDCILIVPDCVVVLRRCRLLETMLGLLQDLTIP